MKTTTWDITEQLNSEEAIVAWIEAISEENDPELMIKAIGEVAKARGITELAKKMGVGRESLYKTFSGKAKPKFTTIFKALDALNLKITIQPKTT